MIEDGITGVCISRDKQKLDLGIPFISYTKNYQPILHRDNTDLQRISYLNQRYNDAIREALTHYPSTKHLLIIDHYYLPFIAALHRLINDYRSQDRVILGGSVWYWVKVRIRPWIAYYDILSVPEFAGKRWYGTGRLPLGIIPVTGVGAVWIVPRLVWERSNGFGVPSPPQAGGSRCLDTSGYQVLLDCDSRFWRTKATNPELPVLPMSKRIINTGKGVQRKLLRMIGRKSL